MSKRRGFGLIELLVVLAILALLIAFLIPATQRVRASAGLLQTNNNLKNCALAMHSYHDTNKKFPDAFNKGGIYNTDKTMWFHILPYIEENNVYANDTADTSVVPPYGAPTDRTNTNGEGRLNFAASIRIFGNATYGKAVNDVGKALAVMDPKTTIKSGLSLGRLAAADGTTNTLMLATRMASCNRTDKGDPIFTTINGDPGTPNGGFFGATAIANAPSSLYAATPTVMYQVRPKDFDELPVGQSVKCMNNPSGVAHSFEGDSVSVALCDGSVRNILTTMTPLTFSRALCPADGNPLGADWSDE